MKILSTLFAFILLASLSETTLAQETPDTPIVHYIVFKTYKNFLINGRVLGVNLEDVQGAAVTNIRTAEKVTTDAHGFFRVNAAKGDTLNFEVGKYSKELQTVKNVKENLNVIMIKKKTDELPASHSQSDYNKAKRADNELYRVLEKDAKLEGKWNY